jgi:hypothetical protein
MTSTLFSQCGQYTTISTAVKGPSGNSRFQLGACCPNALFFAREPLAGVLKVEVLGEGLFSVELLGPGLSAKMLDISMNLQIGDRQ